MSRRKPRPIEDLAVKVKDRDSPKVRFVCTGQAAHAGKILATVFVRRAGEIEVTGPGVIGFLKKASASSSSYAFGCSSCGREVRIKGSRIVQAAGALLAVGVDTLDVSQL